MNGTDAARAFNPGEKRDQAGRWTADAAALDKLASTIRQAQVANVVITGSATGTTADELEAAAAALRRGDRAGAEKILARLRGATAAHKSLHKYHARVRHHHQRVIGPVEALMARADLVAARGGSKQAMLDTADLAAKLLGPDDEVAAHLRAAGEAAGHQDHHAAAGHLAKARDALARGSEAQTGVTGPDPAEHPKAQQRRKLMDAIGSHLRQVRERAGGGMTRGLGWEGLELELLRAAAHFDAKLHPRDSKGEFARKPGGSRPGGRRPGGGRPGAAVQAAPPKRRVTKTSGQGGTPSTSGATVSAEQFTSAVDSLQKAIDTQRAQLDADHKAEIDALKQEITRAHDDAVTEIKAERKVFEKRKAVRKWINHILALVAVALLTYMEAHGMHAGGGEATVAGVGGPILASVAAVGPLIVSEAVDLVKRL